MNSPPRRGSLLVIFLTVFIDLLGFGIVLPLLPIYGKQFAADYGFSPTQVGVVNGILMSSFSLMQLLFLPFWGRMSDRFGRRPILLIGLAGSTVFYACFGIATIYQSLVGLFIARIGAGIAGATISTAQAYIADSTSKEGRSKGMALIGAAFALGFTLGPMLGSVALFMGGRASLSPWPGYVAAILSGSALIFAMFRLVESWHPGKEQSRRSIIDIQALRQVVRTPSIALLLLGTFICVFSFANFEATLSLQVKRFVDDHAVNSVQSGLLDRTLARISSFGFSSDEDVRLAAVFVCFAYLGIVLTLIQGFLVRRLAGRMTEGMMITMGSAVGLVGFALLGISARSGNVGWFVAAMAIEVLGFAFVNPALQALISRRSDPGIQGSILGLAQSCASLGRIAGPVFGSILFMKSPELPYWLACAVLGCGSVLMIWAVRSGRDFIATQPVDNVSALNS